MPIRIHRQGDRLMPHHLLHYLRMGSGHGFAVMDNHFHLICRTRHDISATWDDTEFARRWYRLFSKRRGENGKIPEPTDAELDEILTHDSEGDTFKRAAELRRRLQNVSWLMKCVCEHISRRATSLS